MTNKQTIRIGIVGAGGNTRKRHVPGFRAVDGVEIVGVVNRSPESTAKAAERIGTLFNRHQRKRDRQQRVPKANP